MDLNEQNRQAWGEWEIALADVKAKQRRNIRSATRWGIAAVVMNCLLLVLLIIWIAT